MRNRAGFILIKLFQIRYVISTKEYPIHEREGRQFVAQNDVGNVEGVDVIEGQVVKSDAAQEML